MIWFSFHMHRHKCKRRQTDFHKQAIQFGLTPNITKTQVMKIHSKTRNPIFLNSTALEEVEAFTYLGSVVDTTGGTEGI